MFTPEYPPLRTGLILQSPTVQTLTAAFPIRKVRFRGTRRYVVPTRDGDRLVIHDDIGEGWITGDRVAILVHGMCSSHQAPYVARISRQLLRTGMRTVRIDMRGCGDSMFLSRGHFHGAASDDIADVVAAVRQLSPMSPITLIGFSLGANVILRMIGRLETVGANDPDSVIAVAPPIDLAWSSANLRHWGNRIYDYYFTWWLKKTLQYRRKRVPGLLDNGLIRMPTRMLHLDDQFTAPVNGFAGAREYYRAASPAPMLSRVQIPTLIVTAKDDPVIPFEMFQRWPLSSSIELIAPRHGGHLAFLSRNRSDPDWHWLDWRIVRWIGSLGSNPSRV